MLSDDTGDLFRFLLYVFIICVMVMILGWVASWIWFPLDTLSPERVRGLSQQANDHHESLEAQLRTIETQQEKVDEYEALYGEDTAKWPQGKRDEKQQDSRILQNLIAAYNLSCSQYRALWKDEWRNIPAPDDLPVSCEMYEAR